jgi:regulator of RNase E activity RraA
MSPQLTTAHLADGCIRTGVTVRCAPAAIGPLIAGTRLIGRVLPARHAGSVDVFLEAIEVNAQPGDVLVVDNGGRDDEACVGDLIALEARAAGLAGIVIWGLHRDTADLLAIGLPVFSMGALPTGPLSIRPREASALTLAEVGTLTVTSDDVVAADDDGVLFIPASRVSDVIAAAERIRDVERRQADRIRTGEPLRDQVGFAAYLSARAASPGLTFREHLRLVGGAIEE